MANVLFPKGKQNLLEADIDFAASNMKFILVESTYTYDSTDEFVDDITPASNDNGRSANLSGKTTTNGVADCDDTTITATAAVACNAVILFYDTGSDATALLLAYIDTATGLPFTPSASSTVNIIVDSGASKLFAL
jgi:hypothetical protein